MAKTIGIDSARLAILVDGPNEVVDTSYKALGETGIFTIDAKTSEGITVGNITGLAPTMTKVYGSDMVVETSGKGSGSVTATLGANDIPDDVLASISGMKQDETVGAWYLDPDSRPPYSAIEFISHDRLNNKVHFALHKGTFGPEEHNMQTNTDQPQVAVDSVTFTAVNRKSDKRVYSTINEKDTLFKQDAWDNYVFPTAAAPSGQSIALAKVPTSPKK